MGRLGPKHQKFKHPGNQEIQDLKSTWNQEHTQTPFLLENAMSKEEVIAAIQESAARLGHVPTFTEVRRTMKMSKHEIRKHFLTYATR